MIPDVENLLTVSQQIYIKDTKSMHGTYLDDVKIPSNDTHNVENGEIVRFGVEVARGTGTLPDQQDTPSIVFGDQVLWLPICSRES